MPLTIEEIIARVPDWQDKSPIISVLGGGLTNTNYRVDIDNASFVVRIPGAQTDLLAVDRDNELHNTRAASAANVAPRVLHFLPDIGVMILEFIHGETMTPATLRRPGMPTRMAKVLRKLHAGPRFLHDFNMFRLVEYYLDLVDNQQIQIPAGYSEYLPRVKQIEITFARHPLPNVPCHNDLLAGNYLDDGHHLWLIDFEYSGNNDPTFELGNTCQEQEFDEPRIVEMCAAYFGEPFPDKLARMKLNMIMSDVGWTLWAAIQARISTLAFDYWNWAQERWTRARSKMDGPEFAVWLEAV